MESEVFRTSVMEIYLGKDDIIYLKMFPKADMRIKDAKESYAIVKNIAIGRPFPLLIDIRQISSMDRESRSYFSEMENRFVPAIALVVESPLSKVIGNFFTGLNLSRTPLKLYTSKEEAGKWLRTFINK